MFNKKSKTNSKSKSFGKLPINSRISISYENPKKPKIKFGYPHKKQQQDLADHATPHSLVFLIIYFLITSGLFALFWFSIQETIPYPNNCSANFTYERIYQGLVNGSVNYSQSETIQGNQIFYNLTLKSIGIYNRSLNGMFVSCDNGIMEYFTLNRERLKYDNIIFNSFSLFFEDLQPGFEKEINPNSLGAIIIGFFIWIFAIGWYLLFFVLNKYFGRFMLKFKWYQKLIPEFNKQISGRAYYKIIKEVPANKIVELPLFKNIFLDYNAKGEFAKYLERVEIREHPFCKGVFRKGKLKKKKGDNYMLWYARFYFKEIPKKGKGELIIWWK